MTFDEIQDLAADMRQYLGVDAEAKHWGHFFNDGTNDRCDAIWIGDRRTFFCWALNGQYLGVEHGSWPLRSEWDEPDAHANKRAKLQQG